MHVHAYVRVLAAVTSAGGPAATDEDLCWNHAYLGGVFQFKHLTCMVISPKHTIKENNQTFWQHYGEIPTTLRTYPHS